MHLALYYIEKRAPSCVLSTQHQRTQDKLVSQTTSNTRVIAWNYGTTSRQIKIDWLPRYSVVQPKAVSSATNILPIDITHPNTINRCMLRQCLWLSNYLARADSSDHFKTPSCFIWNSKRNNRHHNSSHNWGADVSSPLSTKKKYLADSSHCIASPQCHPCPPEKIISPFWPYHQNNLLAFRVYRKKFRKIIQCSLAPIYRASLLCSVEQSNKKNYHFIKSIQITSLKCTFSPKIFFSTDRIPK